jgi:hypothetical protein
MDGELPSDVNAQVCAWLLPGSSAIGMAWNR